jgi:hypothetical protein
MNLEIITIPYRLSLSTQVKIFIDLPFKIIHVERGVFLENSQRLSLLEEAAVLPAQEILCHHFTLFSVFLTEPSHQQKMVFRGEFRPAERLHEIILLLQYFFVRVDFIPNIIPI